MKKVLNLVFAFVVIISFTACDNKEDNTPTIGNLLIDFTGLEELGSDFVYEGWLIVNGSPVSKGTFTSVSFPQTFPVGIDDLNSASTFVLSIEPATDNDPAPAATKLLAGDFSSSWGKYILATPTDADDSNEASGVWFLDNSSGSAAVGLGLPTLTDGWKYEGWIVLNGTPISTGTFTDPATADDNAATSPYKGTTGNGPGFPGEDYLIGSAAGVNFPTDLKGATVVVSVEPYPDNSTLPFTLKPLAHSVPTDAANHSAITMGEGPKSVLIGTVSR